MQERLHTSTFWGSQVEKRNPAVADALREILLFEVHEQRYGLAVADVREVLRAVALTPLPRAPTVIEGIINLRGAIVPVLDLRRRFQLPLRPIEPDDQLIVALAGRRVVALRVDRALGLGVIEASAVDRAEAVLPGVDYVAQVARFPDGLVFIHDLATFLSATEAEALATALAAKDAPS